MINWEKIEMKFCVCKYIIIFPATEIMDNFSHEMLIPFGEFIFIHLGAIEYYQLPFLTILDHVCWTFVACFPGYLNYSVPLIIHMHISL